MAIDLNIDGFLAAASSLIGLQVEAGNTIREQSKSCYGPILDAHMLVTGVLGSALIRRNGEMAAIKGDSQRQVVLIAGFVQGVNLVECSISEGYYIQAASLLRQELEMIAALEELKRGARKDERTPNVKHVPWSLAVLYGDLSAAAHAADHNILQQVLQPERADLPENSTGTSMVQTFSMELAWRLYGLHVALLIQLAVHLNDHHETVHGDGLTAEEARAVKLSQEILLTEGWLVRI